MLPVPRNRCRKTEVRWVQPLIARNFHFIYAVQLGFVTLPLHNSAITKIIL